MEPDAKCNMATIPKIPQMTKTIPTRLYAAFRIVSPFVAVGFGHFSIRR